MWLIIGYGNRLRGDDGAGPVFAEMLAKRLTAAQAQVLSVHQLTPELVLEMIKPETERVLFIDVKRQQCEAAEISPLLSAPSPESSCGHQLPPELLLHTAENLYARSLPGWLLTLPGRDFSFSEQLSPCAATALETALAPCLSFLNRFKAHEFPTRSSTGQAYPLLLERVGS